MICQLSLYIIIYNIQYVKVNCLLALLFIIWQVTASLCILNVSDCVVNPIMAAQVSEIFRILATPGYEGLCNDNLSGVSS